VISKKRVVIVGAGLAGLASAIRLAAAGVQVTVIERGTRPGGKMGRREIGPYRWDSGPTIFTLPELFDQLWSAAGAKRSDDLTLLLVEPASRTFFADGSVLETSSDLTKLAASFGALDPRDAAGIPAFMRRGEKLWRELDQTFFRKTLNPLSLLAPSSWLAGLRLDAATPYSRRINQTFHDERIRHVMRYKSIYLGSTPQSVPGAFLSIPYIEAKFGTWHPAGGMHEAPLAMERLARRLGVEFRYGTDAIGSVISNKRISALRIAPRIAQPRTLGTGPAAPSQPGEERIEADAVLFNADIVHANRDLIGEEHLGLLSRRRFKSITPSSSAYILHLGVKSTFPDLAHHTVWHPENPNDELDRIISSPVPSGDPTLYIQHVAATDPSARLDGRTALYVLTPVPPLKDRRWWEEHRDEYRAATIKRVCERTGLKPEEIEEQADWTPLEFEREQYCHDGSIFALAASFFQSAYFRPANASPDIANAFFAGGGSQPGGGIPLVMLSGYIASRIILQRLGLPLPPSEAGQIF
jgi:phytoene desaturase